VRRYILEHVARFYLTSEAKILNAGSGGDSLGLQYRKHFHVDLAHRGLGARAAVANIQALPFADSSFDLIVCVGSVINYCDAYLAISEMARALKPQGKLILEFERSRSFEFILTSAFDANAHVVQTFYNEHTQYLWVYSEKYLLSVLEANDMRLTYVERFHIISPLLLRLTNSPGIAAKLAEADLVLRKFNFLARLSCNAIFVCEKTT